MSGGRQKFQGKYSTENVVSIKVQKSIQTPVEHYRLRNMAPIRRSVTLQKYQIKPRELRTLKNKQYSFCNLHNHSDH